MNGPGMGATYQKAGGSDSPHFHSCKRAPFDIGKGSQETRGMISPEGPFFAGPLGAWAWLGLKIAAAMGFMAAANLVILYAS